MPMDVKDFQRLKGLVDAGMADLQETIAYRKALQEQNGVNETPAPAPQPQGGEMTLKVDPKTFEGGWSTGGSAPPDHDAILPGICEGYEMARDGSDTIFWWFKSEGAEQGERGYWRGAYVADKISAGDGRAGKVKDTLLALGIGYRLQGSQVTFADPRGKKADCDWQTVEVKGKRERRIQGVYPLGERKQSV